MEKERKIIIDREQAPLADDKELGEYTIRRWNWHQKQRCLQRSTEVLDAEKGLFNTDPIDYNMHMVQLCTTGPDGKELELKQVMDLDPDVGHILLTKLKELNGVTPGEKKDFTDPPGEA